MTPTLGPAASLALRALWREGWLLAPGLLVTALRRARGWPALAFAWGIAVEAALRSPQAAPLDPLAPAAGVVAAFTAPRVLAVSGGLWLAGAVAGALLRVAWLSGALPALGGALSGGAGGAARFAAGMAYGFPRVLAAAMLGLVAEARGPALRHRARARRPADHRGGRGRRRPAARSRRRSRWRSPWRWRSRWRSRPLATRRWRARRCARRGRRGPSPGPPGGSWPAPAPSCSGALVFGLLGALAPVSVEVLGSALTGFAAGAPAAVMLGPTLLLSVLAVLVAAALDLAWLGTVSVLACGGGPVRPAGQRLNQRRTEIFRIRVVARW